MRHVCVSDDVTEAIDRRGRGRREARARPRTKARRAGKVGALSSRSAQPSACSREKPVRAGAGAGGAPLGGGGGGAAWQVF